MRVDMEERRRRGGELIVVAYLLHSVLLAFAGVRYPLDEDMASRCMHST